jgi:hypothetical protein
MQPINSTTGLVNNSEKVKDNLAQAKKDAREVQRMLGQSAGGRGGFATPQMIMGGPNGGGPAMPPPVGPAAAGMSPGAYRASMAAGIMSASANAVAAGVGLLPNAVSGINRQQIRYHTGVMAGGYQAGLGYESGVQAGIGNRVSGINEIQRTAAVASGAFLGSSQAQNLGNFGGWAALTLGYDNSAAAQAHLNSVSSAQYQNASLMAGVRTTDAQGNRIVGEQAYASWYRRLGFENMTPEQMRRSLQVGGAGHYSLSQVFQGEDLEMAKTYMLNRRSQGTGYSMATPGKEATDRNVNPLAGILSRVTAEDKYVEAGTKDAVAGFGIMNGALETATEGLTAFYQALGPATALLQQLNGAGVGWNNSFMGNALSGAGGNLLDAAGDVADVMMLRSMMKGKGGGRAGKAAGSLVSKIGAKVGGRAGLKAAGKTAGKLGSRAIPGLGALVSGGFGFMDAKNGEGFWGGALGSTLGGALGGMLLGIPGGPAGMALGALGGAAGGFVSHSAGYAAGSLFNGGADYSAASDGTGMGTQRHAEGVWNVSRAHLAKIHEGETILPADVAESFRSSVQKHMGGGDQQQRSGQVNVYVELKNASWGEAQRLVQTVKEAVETSQSLNALASV